MNGPDHYRHAEALLNAVEEKDLSHKWVVQTLAVAQVHATLALAAATAYPAVKDWTGECTDGLHWSQATS